MDRLRELIGQLEEDELNRFEAATRMGAIESLINRRRQQLRTGKSCPICSNDVGEEGFTLFFGPEGLRKQASFDGLDCLECFLTRLRRRRDHAAHRIEEDL